MILFQNVCREVFCPPAQSPLFGSCVEYPFQNLYFEYAVKLQLIPTTMSLEMLQKMNTISLDADYNVTDVLLSTFAFTQDVLIRKVELYIDYSKAPGQFTFFCAITCVSQTIQPYFTFASSIEKMHSTDNFIELNISSQFLNFQIYPMDVSVYGANSRYFIFYPFDDIYLRTLYIHYNYLSDLSGVRFAFDITPPYLCKYILVNETELCALLQTDPCGQSRLFRSKFYGTYFVLNRQSNESQTYRICADKYFDLHALQLSPMSLIGKTERILILIFTAVSLPAMILLTVLIISQSGSHFDSRTVLSHAFISLCFALASFPAGYYLTDYEFPCVMFAILNHYFWLASFFSFTSLCVMVNRKLDSISRQACSTDVFYSLGFSYLLPMVFVSITITSSMIENEKIGYGLSVGICQISDRIMRLSVFIFPIFFAVVVNALSFWRLLRKVNTMSDTVKINFKQSDYKTTRICLEFMATSAAAWFAAMLHEFVDSVIVTYIYIILFSCQGILFLVLYYVKGTDCCEEQHRLKPSMTSILKVSSGNVKSFDDI